MRCHMITVITTIPKIENIGLFDLSLTHTNNQFTKKRLVKTFEIELPINDGGLTFIDDKVYPTEKDRLICAKPGQWRYSKAPFSCQYIHLTPSESEICDLLSGTPDTIKLDNDSKIPSLFDKIILEYARSLHNFTLSFYIKLFKLFNEIQSKIITLENNKLKDGNISIKPVEKALNYIDLNYTMNITLDDISKAASLSPSHLHKLFSESLGMTPFEYMINRRIKKSMQLLTITNYSISEIASSCGFTDQSYFGKIFKAKTGYTPLNYRKKSNDSYP